MKKMLFKMLSTIIYILALLGLCEFKFWVLFDIKMMLMVAFGTILLTLSGYKKGMAVEDVKASVGWNSMVTAYLTTFVLLFSRLSNNNTDHLLYDVAMNCRPLLYSLIIFALMKGEPIGIKKQVHTEDDNASEDKCKDGLDPQTVENKLKEHGLTEREIEIVLYINEGLSNKEISDRLFISESTVKKHTSNLYKKIDVNNREQLKSFLKG